MEAEAYIFDLHKAHKKWKSGLDFYADDLLILKNRLAEVSIKNTRQEVKMDVEKFQNQFIIQKIEIDKLSHQIQLSDDTIEENIKANPVAVDHRKMNETTNLEDRMETFKSLFAKMKEEFNDFVAKNL